MTDYSGLNALGFILCVPCRLVPRFLVEHGLAPPVKTDKRGRALIAPYAIRKVEAALYMAGFSEEEVIVTTPERLSDVVGPGTKVVAIHVLDPMGLAPVPYTLRLLMGGGDSWTKVLFLELMKKVRKLKEKYRFKVVVGGPGTWQLRGIWRDLGIDVLIHGEGEVIFPEICKRILAGEDVSGEFDGGSVPLELIPAIRYPARQGAVQITRGCPKRCRFCNPTMFNFRSMPLDLIAREVKVNKSAGFRHVELITEDGLLYGAKGVKVNRDAVKALMKTLKEQEVTGDFAHVSISSVLQAPDLVEEWTIFVGHSEKNPYLPQIGLETGSVRLLKIYMAGKPAPFRAEEWHNMAIEATELMNEYYWYPCYTLVLGLPGETPEDVYATIDLIRKLKGSKCWIFPLAFIPMGRSMLEHEKFVDNIFIREPYTELLYETFDHNIQFSKYILDVFVSKIRNRFIRQAVKKFIAMSLSVFENLKQDVKHRLPELIEQASKVNLNTPFAVPKLVLSYIFSKFRR